MPSARELLQQADALMRSNRSVGKSVVDDHVPVLTDVAIPATPAPDEPGVASYREEKIPVLTSVVPDFEIDVPKDASRARFPGSAMNASLLPLTEMPPLPHFDDTPSIVAQRERASRIERAAAAEPLTEIPSWLDANLLQPTPHDAAPAPSAPAIPASDPHEVGDATTAAAAAMDAPGSDAASEPDQGAPDVLFEDEIPAPTPHDMEPASATTGERSAAEASALADLAETIYYQVLQNLDLYTERALQEHLTRHLAPIIQRAGNELLSTLNANLGAVIRQYVAEAIEKQMGVRPTSDTPAGTAR
jgi:hypothetical protein